MLWGKSSRAVVETNRLRVSEQVALKLKPEGWKGAGGTAFQTQGTASAKTLRPEKAEHSLETVEVYCGGSIMSEREWPRIGSNLVLRVARWSRSRCPPHFRNGSTRNPVVSLLVSCRTKAQMLFIILQTGVPSKHINCYSLSLSSCPFSHNQRGQVKLCLV